MIPIAKDFVGFRHSTFDVKHNGNPKGFRLINVNLKPCSYEIMTSMGMSKRAWALIKHEVVIQVVINKLANLYHNVGPSDGYTCYIL
jgi:hypothetical protein